MAKDSDHLAGRIETENTGGFLTGFLAEEHVFDRRALLRLVVWGVAAVAAVSTAMVAGQSSMAMRRGLVTEADLARQSQLIQSLAREGQNETRRLGSAIDTLNGDRDRLFSRMTVLEQGLDAVTSSISRQTSNTTSPQVTAPPASAPQGPPPAVLPSPVSAMSPKPATSPTAQAGAAAASPPPQAVASTPAVMETPPASPASPPTSAAVAKAISGAMARQAAAAASAQTAAAPAASATTDQPAASSGLPAAQGPVSSTAAKSADKPPIDRTDSSPATASSATQPPPTTKPQAIVANPSPPLVASTSMMGPPDPAAGKLIEPAKPASEIAAQPPDVVGSVSGEPEESRTASGLAVKRTEFAVDVGGASSVGGLRAIWHGLLKTNSSLTKLSPVIVVKEGSGGFGMQLRLVAGPLDDAAAAAKICAALIENQRSCEPTVFDGQRLAVKADESPSDAKAAADPKVPLAKPGLHKRNGLKRSGNDDPQRKTEPSTLSSLFSRH